MSQIAVKCRKLSRRLSWTPLCEACLGALKPTTGYSCTHAILCGSPGELGLLGKLLGVSPKSAWPIRGAHSAWACQAARSSVHEIGPHSSELAVLFAKENPKDPSVLFLVRSPIPYCFTTMHSKTVLCIVIHYSKHSKSIQNVVIHYIFSSESLRVVNSLGVLNSLRVLFLVCRGPLGTGCLVGQGSATYG